MRPFRARWTQAVESASFQQHWAPLFGWPKAVARTGDCTTMEPLRMDWHLTGVEIRQAGLESPEHIGRCERQGGILKRAFKCVVRENHVPVSTSMGRLRPCTSAEVLAYEVLNCGNLRFERAQGEREQRRYVDAQKDTTRRFDGDTDLEGAWLGQTCVPCCDRCFACKRV